MLVREPRPVLLYLTVEWSGTCCLMAPTVEAVIVHFGNALRGVRVDVEADPAFREYFRLRELPLLLVFREGELLGRFAGLVSRRRLIEQLESLLDLPAGSSG